MSCDGSQLETDSGWVFIPKGQKREVTIGGVRYICVGCGRCTPESHQKSGGYTGSYRSTGDWRTDLMVGLMQSFMQGFMRGLQGGEQTKKEETPKWLKEFKEWQEKHLKERQKEMEDWRNEIRKQTQEMQKQYAFMRENEFKEKKQRLLSRLKSPDSSSGNLLSLRSLKCSAYWSMEAAKLASSGDEESLRKAREYSLNSERAMQGDLSNCLGFQPEVDIPDYSDSNIYREEFQQEFLKVLTREANDRVNSLNEIKKKKDELLHELVKVEEKVKEIEEARGAAENEKERQQYDELLNEALKALDKAKEEKKKAEEEILRLNQEIKAISEIYTTLFSTKKED